MFSRYMLLPPPNSIHLSDRILCDGSSTPRNPPSTPPLIAALGAAFSPCQSQPCCQATTTGRRATPPDAHSPNPRHLSNSPSIVAHSSAAVAHLVAFGGASPVSGIDFRFRRSLLLGPRPIPIRAQIPGRTLSSCVDLALIAMCCQLAATEPLGHRGNRC